MTEGGVDPASARAHPRADRPRPGRSDAAGNRRQHHGRTDCGAARQGGGAQGRLAAMVPQPQSASLSGPRRDGLIIRGATIVTMNDAFDVVEGDVLIRDGRFVADWRRRRNGACRSHHRRARRVPAPRFHPDAYPPVPDAVSRLRRRSRAARLAQDAGVAHGGSAHAGLAGRRRQASGL